MLNKTQLKILSYLIDNQDKFLGIRELARRISVVYYLVHRNIQYLKEKNIVIIEKAGKTSLIRLHPMVNSSYLVEAEKLKRELFYSRHPSFKVIFQKIIEQSKSCFFILLVFGSYAKQQEKKDSDLDLLVIVPSQGQINMAERVISSIARTSSVKIHDSVISESSFVSMLQKKELNIGLEAKEKHILIYGNSLYYKLII